MWIRGSWHLFRFTCTGWWANGVLFTAWFTPNTSSPAYMPSASYCKTVPATNSAYVGQAAASGILVSARSFHLNPPA
jgi:hypothetical protein